MKVKKIAFEIGKAVIIVGALRVGEEVFRDWKHDRRMREMFDRKEAEKERFERKMRESMKQRLHTMYNRGVSMDGDPEVVFGEDGEVKVIKFKLKMK